MKSVIKLMVIFVFALLFISLDSNAQSTTEQIEELKQQIEAMRVQHQQQIEQLQQQIDLLDAAREDDKGSCCRNTGRTKRCPERAPKRLMV